MNEDPVLSVALGNPYRSEIRQLQRQLKREGTWPSDVAGWSAWYQGARERFGPEIAGTALVVGARAGEAVQVLRDESRSTCMELGARALEVEGLLDAIVGNTPVMHEVRAAAWGAAFGRDLARVRDLAAIIRSTPVLIQGETGTGKELVAQALGRSMEGKWENERWTPAPFEPVHLASIPDTLVEEALFGHDRDAFTGAKSRKPGVLERCDGGVVFLDEIAELPLKTQVALLRVLQEGKVRRLGGTEDVRAAPRIISATHKDLEGLVREGSFREDLYHRLTACVLRLPPLRERIGDLLHLAVHEMRDIPLEAQLQLRQELEQHLETRDGYHWPGNVRELFKIVRSLALGIPPQPLAPPPSGNVPAGVAAGKWTMDQVRRWYAEHVSSQGGSQVEIARRLGLDRHTLGRLLKEKP
jgi:DNA-binding NtrC family response regulator